MLHATVKDIHVPCCRYIPTVEDILFEIKDNNSRFISSLMLHNPNLAPETPSEAAACGRVHHVLSKLRQLSEKRTSHSETVSRA